MSTTQPVKCSACAGRGYHNCDCWPGDCICGIGDMTCEECRGEGLIDTSYDDVGTDCDCSNYETDLLDGSARCHRCGRSWPLSQEGIAAEIEFQAAYMASEATPTEADSTCDICAEPLLPDDICATDIEMGICHAACLDGSPVVDLETGEPIEGGTLDTYRFGDISATPSSNGGKANG